MIHVFLCAVLALAGPVPGQAPTGPGTWILQLRGDATALVVVGATHKAFPFKAPRGVTADYRLSLVDQKGAVLATVPLDLSSFCMDRTHGGHAGHVRGDVVFEHAVACTVKIPARTDVAEVRIEDVKDPKMPVALGSIDRASLLVKTAVKKDAKQKETR